MYHQNNMPPGEIDRSKIVEKYFGGKVGEHDEIEMATRPDPSTNYSTEQKFAVKVKPSGEEVWVKIGNDD